VHFDRAQNGNSDKVLEETLDPEDWEALRGLGHRMLDDMITYLQTVRSARSGSRLPEPVKRQLKSPFQ
jgi:hypothetical protein